MGLKMEDTKNFTDNKLSRILVVGDIMLDIYLEGEIDRISPEAPVPVFKYTGEHFSPGGGANVAANLKMAGAKVSLLSVTGKDVNGDRLIDMLNKMGIDTGMVIRSKRSTTVKTRFIANDHQQVMRSDIEESFDISEDEEAAALKALNDRIEEYDILVISDYKKGFLTGHLVKEIISLSRKKGIRVVADIKDNKDGRYNGACLLKPNKKELSKIAGENLGSKEDVIRAAKDLLNRSSCEYVLVTLGAGGMILVGNDISFHIPACGKEVFDVTGAGDTVLAYLAAMLALGKDEKEAVMIANTAAGIEVGKAGTYQPSLSEVMAIFYGSADHACIGGRGYNGDCYTYDKGSNDHSYRGSGRIWKRSDAAILRDSLKGKRIVFTNGCFDVIHVGHIRCLNEARKLGDVLIVGVNSDDSVKRLKGKNRPVNSLNDRMEVLAALSSVDHVISFDEDTPYELISEIMPDVLVKGGDYLREEVVGADIVEKNGGKVVIIPLTEGRSTTSILEKM